MALLGGFLPLSSQNFWSDLIAAEFQIDIFLSILNQKIETKICWTIVYILRINTTVIAQP